MSNVLDFARSCIKELTSQQNNTLYFDDEHDNTREKVRKLYFAFPDEELRKSLISKAWELDDNSKRMEREGVSEASKKLALAKDKLGQLPWEGAALRAIISVAVAYWVFGMVGALAGAVGGVFLGFGHISSKRHERNREVTEAEEALNEAKNSIEEAQARPDLFSASEVRTGVEDQEFSSESAFQNRVQISLGAERAGRESKSGQIS